MAKIGFLSHSEGCDHRCTAVSVLSSLGVPKVHTGAVGCTFLLSQSPNRWPEGLGPNQKIGRVRSSSSALCPSADLTPLVSSLNLSFVLTFIDH